MGHLWITLLGVLVALLVFAAERAGVTWAGAVRRTILRGVIRLAEVIGLIGLLAVALPTLYLPGLVARFGSVVARRGQRWNDDRSNWVAREDRRMDRVRDAKVPYTSAPARLRRRRNLAGVVFVAAVLLAAGQVLQARSDERASNRDQLLSGVTQPTLTRADVEAAIDEVESEPFSKRPAFEGVDFADDLQAELQEITLSPSPAGVHRPEDFAGRFTSIRDGVRVTSTTTCVGCPTTRLWLVGGSAAFGLGQRDDYTIGSRLVALASEQGIALEVRNMGVPGWTLWQEQTSVMADLASTDHPPDLVVFFDGYNDVVGTMASSVVRGVRPAEPVVMDPEEVLAFLQVLPSLSEDIDPVALGDLAAQRYDLVREQIEAELGERGIESAFFFQPDALTVNRQRRPVEDLYSGHPQEAILDHLPVALESAADALSPEVHNLRHLFDDHPRVVFPDSVHTNEDGAEVTAEAMYDVLRESIRRSAS